jgi:penicillin amidase
VKGAAAETVTLKFTHHGPVLWEDVTHHRALALHWVGSEPGTAGYLASLSVDRATSWKEFVAALQRWKLPPENMIYADTQGNIGEQSAGLTPIRKWTGLLPVPGTGEYEWSGFVPLDQLPRTLNPADGWFATANNRTIPEDYKYKVGYEWSTFRVERIRQVLGELASRGQKVRLEDMQNLQNDVYSIPANELIRMLPRKADGAAERYLEMLKDWDRKVLSPSVPGALYEVWERRVRSAVLDQIAGAAAPEFAGSVNIQCAIDYLNAMPADDRQRLLLTSLADAGQEMVEKQGDDAALWSWGAMHTMTFRHSLDRQPGGKALFDLGPVARPGDGNTVDATGTRGASFEQASGASYREIFDLGNWDNSLAVNTPGQSGQPESRHYDDLLALWSAGQYFQLVYSRQQVQENATDVLTLTPTSHRNARSQERK